MVVQDFFLSFTCWAFVLLLILLPLIPDLIVRVFRFVITEDTLIIKPVIFSWELDFTTFVGYKSTKTMNLDAVTKDFLFINCRGSVFFNCT